MAGIAARMAFPETSTIAIINHSSLDAGLLLRIDDNFRGGSYLIKDDISLFDDHLQD